jgi:hypothetical protein
VARVDPADDSIKRFVVRLYAFDESRRERRHQEIAAFDTEADAMHCLGEAHRALLDRKATGEADPRDTSPLRSRKRATQSASVRAGLNRGACGAARSGGHGRFGG